MATFCAGCGSALSDGVKFCDKCGRPVPVASPAIGGSAPPPVAPVVAPTSQGSNTAIKIIFAVLAVIMFLGLIMVGSCFYVAYRVRQKANELSSSLGGNDVPRYSGKREPCALLTAEEAGRALGQTVSSVEPRGTSSCQYQFGDNGQHMGVQFAWRGGAMTMKMTQGAMKQIGMASFTAVPGVGDEAYLAPMNAELLMRKGDVLVTIELQSSGVSADAAKKVAATIADRL
jgi:hypothetical protein